jgi:hypothetical protein
MPCLLAGPFRAAAVQSSAFSGVLNEQVMRRNGERGTAALGGATVCAN